VKANDGVDVKSATQPSIRLTFQEFVINLKLAVLCKMCTSDEVGETLPAEDITCNGCRRSRSQNTNILELPASLQN
jgi:hypothetical protein